ncbi:hypothetical protein MLD38_013118 [Melastoma candidum]|uniref:Uncharacterized protein n=1 Tax=Melastoma candidum TaxID=119954 RepID=A0ACB9RAD7_9MYRT|nr:hypothetical protein MLD38_013118 [Melastoma candidum]
MKSSFGKLKKLAVLHKSDHKEKIEYQHLAQLDELANASKDMQDMRNCYDSLLSAAAATANSAYESLREMGMCILEKTSLYGDEETGRALSMLGNVQFELQRLIDTYRSHLFMTVTHPSESLLHELRTVEEMKRQCDDKRDVYEYMITQQKEKGKSKGGKIENVTFQKLQSAHDEYAEEARLCAFRLKSLKQEQSRSFITQAARHHAAQLNFFRRGLKCLEAVEPRIRMITEQHHIDYHLVELEDEADNGEDDKEDAYGGTEDGELSFDYRQDVRGQNVFSTAKNEMEVDDRTLSFSRTGNAETAELDSDRGQGDVQMPTRARRDSSHSAPIFTEKKSETSEKVRYTQKLSGQKTNSYVLPTPDGVKGTPSNANSSVLRSRPASVSRHNPSLWHSSPLEQTKHEMKSSREVRESGNTNQVPPPLSEGLVSYSDTPKRQAFSGPLTSKPMSKKPVLHASGPMSSSDIPHLVPGMLPRVVQCSSSPGVSPTASPPLVSSPRVSELHELPRPPGNLAMRPSKSMVLAGHSAPLVSRNLDGSVSSKIPATASPLPPPPLLVPRSFSIPPSSQRATAFHAGKPVESPRASGDSEEISSPPLTPIALMDIKPVPAVAVYHSGPMRGGS